ncbi:MAG: hypothetical protein VYB53_03245 [Bacteroidota bacterium]|nr:hypothetical protein [Bacteroidota bacterium]
MKKLLLIALISISFQLVSQAQGEMKFVNTNLVEYNGERIKIKEAKKMTKEINVLAFKQFRRAQICRGFAIASDVAWLGLEILHYVIRKDNEENLNLNDGQDAYDRGYTEALVDGQYSTMFSTGLVFTVARLNFIHLGVKAFNEGN